MLIIPDEKISEYLNYKKLIETLREIFQSDYTMPVRHHHFYKTLEGHDNTIILMPVWINEYMGMKHVTVAPANANRNMPSIFAQYILSNSKTGQPLAMMNATELTSRRMACTSALASFYLSRQDSENLLIVGGGSVAKHLVHAHLAVRNFKKVSVWMRNSTKMDDFVGELKTQRIPAEAVDNLE